MFIHMGQTLVSSNAQAETSFPLPLLMQLPLLKSQTLYTDTTVLLTAYQLHPNNQSVNKFTAYYGCPSSLSRVLRSLGHDSAPMGNRIRTFHGNAVPSVKDFWDVSTQHHSPSKRQRLTTQWRGVQTNWILCYTAVKTQNSLSGHKIPQVPILGHTSSIHVLMNYLFDSYQNTPPHIKDGFGLRMPFPRLCVRSSPILTQMTALVSKHCHLDVSGCNWSHCLWATQIRQRMCGCGCVCVCVCVT